MKIFIFLISLFTSSIGFAQSWQQVVETQGQALRTFYLDPVDSLLYIGGYFRLVINGNDTTDARGIVRWDGENFEALGYFPNSLCTIYNCNSVRSIVRYKDEIYSSLINSVPEDQSDGDIKGIARWNGITWDSLPGGIDGGVYKQIVYKDELYIMGRFKEAGNMEVHSIIKWDGEQWHDVAFPYYYDEFDSIDFYNAMVHEGELYVVGNFWSSDETVKDVAKYDGENWHPVGNGVQGGWDDVGKIIVYKDEIYISGDFKASAGNAGSKIMKLVNDEWVAVGGSFPSYGTVSDMLIWDDLLYVFGGFDQLADGTPAENIAVWDGEKWCGYIADFSSFIKRAIRYKDNLLIQGNFSHINNETIRRFAQWDGGHLTDTCQLLSSTNNSFIDEIEISISPNPTQNTLSIQLSDNLQTQPLTLQIHSPTGHLLHTQTHQNSTNQLHLNDLSFLPSGIYFLEVQVAGTQQRVVRKFSVVR